MPDENRVFDITKPSRVNPPATSKPVIVGHRPEMADPMVKEHGDSDLAASLTPEPTKVLVDDGPPAGSGALSNTSYKMIPGLAEPMTEPRPADGPSQAFGPSAIVHDNSPAPIPTDQPAPPPPEIPPASSPSSIDPTPQIEELHFSAPQRRRKWPWILLIILILLIGAYLAIDSNLIHTNINLPVHFFKQKTNSPPAASNSSSNSNNTSANSTATPAGFSEYHLTGTDLTFAAPTSWGNPTSTPVPGYSKNRGGSNQSDGTFAYLVDFATNKDVELAVTSSKYLPPPPPPTYYYYYLQWCTGTNDGKYYESTLNFTTANKIDTPTTITCDQGPVPNVTQIDSTTIVQSKAQDTSGKTIGDIYTKNLTDPSLVVFRVKDAAMTNGTDIKQLLNTVQITGSSTSSSGQ